MAGNEACARRDEDTKTLTLGRDLPSSIAASHHFSLKEANDHVNMSTLPAYDLSLDELSTTLSYVTLGLGGTVAAVPPTAPPSAAQNASTSPKTETKDDIVEVHDGDDDDDDDFDVFGDDNDDEEVILKESRAEMFARLKTEAEERTAKKEAQQRTLVGIEIKPFSIEQDLMELWRRITKEVTQDGIKWGESCTLAPVAFGIEKIQTTFVMGVNNSSEDVQEAIETKFDDEVQSVEITSMNVL